MESPTPAEQNGVELTACRLDEAVHSVDSEVLQAAAKDSSLTQDLALTMLKRGELPGECLVALSKNAAVAKYRKVRVGIVGHVRTPRHVSLPLLRLLYTFDLMQIALMPAVLADIKRLAEEVLLAKLEMVSSGEKLTLARRASGRIAAELLVDKESRVMRAALDNPRLTEAAVAKILVRANTSSALVERVCHHPKWSRARDIRIALLRNEKTPLARALEFARSLPPPLLREILQNSRLPHSTKSGILRQLQAQPRTKGKGAAAP